MQNTETSAKYQTGLEDHMREGRRLFAPTGRRMISNNNSLRVGWKLKKLKKENVL